MVDQSTTAAYYHPYATLQWLHTPAGGEEQNAELLSGYVSGATSKTLTLSTATPAETGYLRCRFTNPVGDHAYSATANLTGTEGVAPISFTVHPQNLTITETVPAVVPPVFTVHPQDLTLTETVAGPAEYLHDFTTKQIGAWTHTRASDATAPNESGTIVTYTADQPAWYRDQGLQLEDARTNTLHDSNDLTTSAWTRTNATVTGSEVYATASNGRVYHNNQDITAQQVLSGTFEYVDNENGAGQDITVELTPNLGVYGANTLTDGSTERFEYSADDRFNFPGFRFPQGYVRTNVTRMQCEAGTFKTSYIPTSGATYTRAATNCAATFAELGAPLPAGGFTNDFCFQCVVYLTTDYPDIVATGNANRFISLNVGTVSADNVCELFAIGNDRVQGYIRKGATTYAINLWEAQFANLVAGDSFDFRLKISSTEGQKAWVTTKFGTISGTHADTSGFSVALTQVDMNRAENYKPAQTVWSKIRIVPEALTDEEIEAWT